MIADTLFIAIAASVCIVAVAAGYFIAHVRGQGALALAQQTMDSLRAEKQGLQDSCQALSEQHSAAAEGLRISELEAQKLSTMLSTQSTFQNNLEQRLQAVQAKADNDARVKHKAITIVESLKTQLREVRLQQHDLAQRLQRASAELQQMRSRLAQQQQANATLQTSIDERELAHAQALTQFEEQKQALSGQFKVLANDILDNKAKALQENSKLSLSAVMDPFQESINSFKQEVHAIHARETSQRGELRKELQSLKELNQLITAEAHELSTALRGQTKLQGNWGEMVLENVLDRDGLQRGKDYKREVSISTEQGRQRPDVIVYLPQDKHLIIDAKVSLNAYVRFVNSEDEVQRKMALDEHVRAMADRIKELADRDYYKLPGLNSPDMVFMFVPIESAFVEALKADETLFQSAIENNVLVATPTTLLTSLNIVRQLWRYEDQNQHTVALAQKSAQVFKKLNAFLASFEGIKKGLENAAESYAKAEGQLVSGRGNLVKQVGEFKKLAPAIQDALPRYFVDKAELEIDYLAAEPKIKEVD